jgi:hypothetical protein
MRASDQAARPTLTAPALPDLIAPKNYAGNAAVMALDAPRPSEPEQPQLKSALERLSSLEDKIPEIGLSRAKAQEIPGTPGSAGSSGRPGKGGVAKFEGKQVADWIAPILRYARKQGWKGSVNSGYRSKAEQTRIYNSGVRPAAKPGTSNHEFAGFPGGAVDVCSERRALRRQRHRAGVGRDVLVAWPIAFLIGVGVGLILAGRGYRIVRTRNGKEEG